MMPILTEVQASCAICGAPPIPECPHERASMELALNQAMLRWSGFNKMREWVLDHARDAVISGFEELKTRRYNAHLAYLHTLPCFSLYTKWNGAPPHLNPSQLATLQSQIAAAREMYKTGVDDDWRKSCQTYPMVLDYYFDLVEVDWPHENDIRVLEPEFGGGLGGAVRLPKRAKARRGSRGSSDVGNDRRRKKDRRRRSRSRGHTPVGRLGGAFGGMRI